MTLHAQYAQRLLKLALLLCWQPATTAAQPLASLDHRLVASPASNRLVTRQGLASSSVPIGLIVGIVAIILAFILASLGFRTTTTKRPQAPYFATTVQVPETASEAASSLRKPARAYRPNNEHGVTRSPFEQEYPPQANARPPFNGDYARQAAPRPPFNQDHKQQQDYGQPQMGMADSAENVMTKEAR